MTTKPKWGILRYAPTSGDAPEEDKAAFDGWYVDCADATGIYDEWCRTWGEKGWIVALVQPDKIAFEAEKDRGFAAQLRSCMDRYEINADTLANRAGLQRGIIARYLQGHMTPGPTRLAVLRAILPDLPAPE